MSATPARDVQVFPVAPETLALRSRSWNRLRFEVEYARERGTTANSYLIRAAKTALLDPPGGTFAEIFLAALQQRLPPTAIDYLILGHVNTNRAETLKAFLVLHPRVEIVCTNPAAIALRQLLEGIDLNVRVVRGDETLDLGHGHALQFALTPTPRWPDGLCTFDPKTEILFTDKFFGAHICGDQVFDEGWHALLGDRRYYFDCLMATQTRQVEHALERMARFPASLFAPNHGPIARYGRHELERQYRQWCAAQQQQSISVAMLYASAYGNTTTLANALARGITKAGVAVEAVDCEHATPDEIRAAVERASGFLMGSPTLAGHLPTQIQTALGIVLSVAPKGSLAGVFGSFGWSGEAVDIIAGKLRDAGFVLAFEPVRVKFAPTETTLQTCEETGTDFAQALKKAKRVAATLNPGSPVEQAVGRIVGSLCVVTARRGEVSTAMLASWVSQATFHPPGLTVAVAKERAIEAYLYAGDRFVLNILEQGKQGWKQFTKRFAPGEDRFTEVPTSPASNGAPILTESLAYLECCVQQRMECGDHWLVYAVVEQGKVLQPNGLTAIHYRKSGSHY